MIVWPIGLAALLTVGFLIYLIWIPKPPTRDGNSRRGRRP